MSLLSTTVPALGAPLHGAVSEWNYLEMLTRFALALALGLLIGLERERRKKEAGLRTFGFIAVLGAVGASLGDSYAYIVLCLTGLLTVFLNIQDMRTHAGTELTTSAAMLVTCIAGILCGKGHTLTPAAIMVSSTALLAWKDILQGFSIGLTEGELRSALLLAILGIVIYPALPVGSIGPMGLIEPRAAWATVILIAGIGFVNYVLWKAFGTRGVAIAGFLGGLVNSSVTVNELASRVGRNASGAVAAAAYRGILLATSAMVTRNAVILALLAPGVAVAGAGAYLAMLGASAFFVFYPRTPAATGIVARQAETSDQIVLPFSLWSALKYGLVFLLLHILGVLTQKYFGNIGFYVVSLIGGTVSSASAVAAAASLAADGKLTLDAAATGAIIASLASVAINLPFVLRVPNRRFVLAIAVAMAVIAALGLAGMLLGETLAALVNRHFPILLSLNQLRA
ncbi:MgtC/SapB family protein [Pseudoduganella armeniaca]|uniref:Magnesium transporter accessory protein n=1 Tax=Pseudoduganella armeniaca TaxID=2072590 RepID=A0A2R4C966_9BURK|nr:MgtC/SapB family protein [Pseudoduganella armeniaca]AVR96157.1 magnesium transporter accessory protein [Pseudoduganella armeniaca]